MADQVSQGGITVASETTPTVQVSQGGITVASNLQASALLIHVSQGGITVASEPAPEAPSNVVATPTSSTSIFVEWQNNGINDYDSIDVERNEESGPWSKIADKSGNATSHTDEGLTPNTTYGYRVKAERKGVESDYSTTTADSETATLSPGGSSFVVVIRPVMTH